MDDANKVALLEAFRAVLDENLEERPIAPDVAGPERQADLFSLFSEVASLKNEVHLEARQFKTALEQFGRVVDTLETDRDAWERQLAQVRDAAKQQTREALKPLLIQMLDLHDRLEAGLQAFEQYRPKRFAWRGRRHEMNVIVAMRDGQELTLRRLEQLLASYDVRPIPVLNQELEPHTMRAAEVDHRTDKENGIVTAELRKGFYWGDNVLRAAEVKVNKH